MKEKKDRPRNQQQNKAPTGILNFDHNMHGGLPRGRTSLLIGGPGSGKTVFALQTLVNGARQLGEPGIFVAFEENAEQIIANAASFGWDLSALQRDQLFFLDARMSLDTINSGSFDLAGLLASLAAKRQKLTLAKAEAQNRIQRNEQENESLQQTLEQIDRENEVIDLQQRDFSEGIHPHRKGVNFDGNPQTGTPKEVK